MKKNEFLEKIAGKALKNQVGGNGGYSTVDIKLGDLCELLESNDLEIPNFQRLGNQWSDVERSELVKSILTGKPLPSIIIGICNRDIFLLDGQQRLTSSVLMLQLLEANKIKASTISLVKNYKLSCDVISFEEYEKMKEYFLTINARSGLSAIQKLKAKSDVNSEVIEELNSISNLICEVGKENEGYAFNIVKCLYAKKSTIEKTGIEANCIIESKKNDEGKITKKKTSKLSNVENFAIFQYNKVEDFAAILLQIDNTDAAGSYSTSITQGFNRLAKIGNDIDHTQTLETFITTIIPRFFFDKSNDEFALSSKRPFAYAMFDVIRHSGLEIGIDEVQLFFNYFLNNSKKDDRMIFLYEQIANDYVAGTKNSVETNVLRFKHIENVFKHLATLSCDKIESTVTDTDISNAIEAVCFDEK